MFKHEQIKVGIYSSSMDKAGIMTELTSSRCKLDTTVCILQVNI